MTIEFIILQFIFGDYLETASNTTKTSVIIDFLSLLSCL
jgi:hypothetical protein